MARQMRHGWAVKVALATSHDRMAPCFAGIELRVIDEGGGPDNWKVVATHGWHPLAWGRELMQRDVGLLLCAGIDQATWAAVQGHGIQVIPIAMGDPRAAFAAWSSGRLAPPALWPAYGGGFDGRCRGRGRGRHRRGRFHGRTPDWTTGRGERCVPG